MHIAMQFKHLIIGDAGSLVQVIYILGDNTIQPAQPAKLGNGKVCRVRFGGEAELTE